MRGFLSTLFVVLVCLTPQQATAAEEDVKDEEVFPGGPTYSQAGEEICGLYVFPRGGKLYGVKVKREDLTCERFERDGNKYWITCKAKYEIAYEDVHVGTASPVIYYDNGHFKVDLSQDLKGVINTSAIEKFFHGVPDLVSFKDYVEKRYKGGLKKEIEAMSKAQLKQYLDELNKKQLVYALAIVDGVTLKTGLSVVEDSTLKVAMKNLDEITLIAAVVRLRPSVLKRAIPMLRARRFKFVLENVDKYTLAACFDKAMGPVETDAALTGPHKIDEPTFRALWGMLEKVSPATRNAVKKRRHPKQE